MKCNEFESVLEEYFDSELGQNTQTRVASHIAVCESCAESYQRLEREHDFYLRNRSMPTVSLVFWSEVFDKAGPPPDKSWIESLRSRLVRSREAVSTIRLGPLPIAALVILTIGVTAGVMSYVNSRRPDLSLTSQTPELAPAPAKNPASEIVGNNPVVIDQKRDSKRTQGTRPLDRASTVSTNRQSPDVLVRDAERKYLTAISLLTRDAQRRRSNLDPAALAQFDQALATVDRAIADTRLAVRAHPADPVAVQYMLAAYSRKVDVLRQMVSD